MIKFYVVYKNGSALGFFLRLKSCFRYIIKNNEGMVSFYNISSEYGHEMNSDFMGDCYWRFIDGEHIPIIRTESGDVFKVEKLHLFP